MIRYLLLLLMLCVSCQESQKAQNQHAHNQLAPLWQFEQGFKTSTLRIKDGYLYGIDAGENFVKIKLTDASVKWTMPVDGICTAPEFAGEYIYIVKGNDTLCMMNKEGKMIWQEILPGYNDPPPVDGQQKEGSIIREEILPGYTDLPPVAWQNKVFLYSADTGMIAIDTRSKRQLWNREPSSKNENSSPYPPVVAGNTLFAVIHQEIMSIDPASGYTNWEVAYPGGILSAPVVVDTVLYVGGLDAVRRNIRFIAAFHTTTGKKLWEKTSNYNNIPAPVFLDHHIYVFLEQYLNCLNAQNGSFRWRHSLLKSSERVKTEIVPFNGALVFGTTLGTLYAFDVNRQAMVLSKNIPGEDLVLLKDGNRLFAADADGRLYQITSDMFKLL